MNTKRPLFTSCDDKIAWLRNDIAGWQRIINAQEKRGNWAMSDEAYMHQQNRQRELDELLDDISMSIPRAQRYTN